MIQPNPTSASQFQRGLVTARAACGVLWCFNPAESLSAKGPDSLREMSNCQAESYTCYVKIQLQTKEAKKVLS